MDFDFKSVVSLKKLIDEQDTAVRALKGAEKHLSSLITGMDVLTKTCNDDVVSAIVIAEKQGEIDAARLAVDEYRRRFTQANTDIFEWIQRCEP